MTPAEAQNRGVALGFRTNVVRISPLLLNGQPSPGSGFGIAVGFRDGFLYIATADHVVWGNVGQTAPPSATVMITFFNRDGLEPRMELRGERLPQRLAASDPHGDLAVVRVSLPPGGVVVTSMPVVGADRLQPAADAWGIGRGGEWLVDSRAGNYQQTEAETGMLIFEGLLTRPGSSGGAVVVANAFAGMVVRWADGLGITRVFPAHRIREQFALWRLPTDLLIADEEPVRRATRATYLVFFDWERADLTARSNQIIAEAANKIVRLQKEGKAPSVEVGGHDDGVSPAEAMRISRRRAEVVANNLVRRGVGRDGIALAAYGRLRPRVPVEDEAVREQQNRRVEIVIR